MNDYTEYPTLMWMLTAAVTGPVILASVIPLLAGLSTLQADESEAS